MSDRYTRSVINFKNKNKQKKEKFFTLCLTFVLSVQLAHYFCFLSTLCVLSSTTQYMKSNKDIQHCISVKFASYLTSLML